MLQYEQLCKACTAGECRDKPSECSPALPLCVNCEGGGCDACGGRGRFRITDCPRKMVGANIWDTIQAAYFAEKGVLPVAGGTLDQTQSFMDALALTWRDQSYWKKKLGIIG
jgi:hypothetical protein